MKVGGVWKALWEQHMNQALFVSDLEDYSF